MFVIAYQFVLSPEFFTFDLITFSKTLGCVWRLYNLISATNVFSISCVELAISDRESINLLIWFVKGI